jgi:hypothetical protein
VWGFEHTSLDKVNNLGNLYADQGNMGETEETFLAALRGSQEAVVKSHPARRKIAHDLTRSLPEL